MMFFICMWLNKDVFKLHIIQDIHSTPNLKKVLDENWSTELYHVSFFQIFHVELEYVIFEMIHWANLKGRQFMGTMGQALLPVLAVTNSSNPLSLLPKQAGGLGPWCL